MLSSRDRISRRQGIRAALQPRSGVARAAWRVLYATAGASALALIVFHLWIFWDQLTAGRLLQPEVAVRWLAAGLLSGALIALRRAGVPLTRGRRALSVWLLVVLLHCWAAASPAHGLESAGSPGGRDTAVWFVLPATAATVLLSMGFLLHALFGRRASSPLSRLAFVCSCPGPAPGRTDGRAPLAARAPPFAIA